MAERTIRRPKRPRAYALVLAAAALIVAATVGGTLSLAWRLDSPARPVAPGPGPGTAP